MDYTLNGRRRLAEGYISAAGNIHCELKGEEVINLDYHFAKERTNNYLNLCDMNARGG
jgi:hypothetical protein